MSADRRVRILEKLGSVKAKFVAFENNSPSLRSSGFVPSSSPVLRFGFLVFFASEVGFNFVKEKYWKYVVTELGLSREVVCRHNRLRKGRWWDWELLLEWFLEVFNVFYFYVWPFICKLVGVLFFGTFVEVSEKSLTIYSSLFVEEVRREESPSSGLWFEWHHSFGLGSNPHPICFCVCVF